MIPLRSQEEADAVLKYANGKMPAYRYDMFRFRLRLSLRAPSVWTSYFDQWPEPRVITHFRRNKGSDDTAMMNFDVIQGTGNDEGRISSEEIIEVLYKMFVQLKSLSGPNGLLLSDVTAAQADVIVKKLSQHYFVMPPIRFHTFSVPPTQIECSVQPPNMVLKKLCMDAEYANDFNAHQGVKGLNVKDIISDCIEHLPSLGIFNLDGKLMAYLVTNDYGSVGKLYVLPEYRRKGLASLLVTHLANIIEREGYMERCLINANDTNQKAISCFLKLGCEFVPDSDRYWTVVQ